ncbi:anhydro-N-acetylmuramic acid kinase, partial [Paraglaciecola sp.]
IQIRLSNKLPHTKLSSTTDLSLNPDAKEAVLFALLANETLCANASEPATEKVNMPQVSMGKVSFPD